MSEWLSKVLAEAEELDARGGDRRLTRDRDFGSYLEVQANETDRRAKAFTGEEPYENPEEHSVEAVAMPWAFGFDPGLGRRYSSAIRGLSPVSGRITFELILDAQGFKNFNDEVQRQVWELYGYGFRPEDVRQVRVAGEKRLSGSKMRAIRAALGWANPRSGLTEVLPPPDAKPAETKRRQNAEMRRTVEPGKRKAHWLK